MNGMICENSGRLGSSFLSVRLGWVMILTLGGLMPPMSGGPESLRLVAFT